MSAAGKPATRAVDLHLHSTASDGTDAPEVLPSRVREAGIGTFALTDHDTIEGALRVRGIVPEGLTFILGIEFSCVMESGKCHILGLAFDPGNGVFQQALERGKELRREKLGKRLTFLENNFAIVLTEADRETLERLPSAGKPHLANLLVKKGLAGSRQEAIEKYISPCHTSNSKIDARTAVQAILAAGGVPVWAHPLGGEGERDIPEEQFHLMLRELMDYGLRGLECHYSRYTTRQAEWLADVARQNGLYISGGSDYHGENKSIPLGRLNAEGVDVGAEKLTVLQALRF